jgi:hypothetical protein
VYELTCHGSTSGSTHNASAPHANAERAATMPADKPVQGPASYFSAIEKKYGQPINHWLALVEKLEGMKHMEMVAVLKQDHGMGHGHANAIVAYSQANKK